MKIISFQVFGDFDLPDDAKLGDMFDVVGTATVTATEEKLVGVNVDPRDPETSVFERRATVALKARRA